MEKERYFEEQAHRCYRLARGCFDLSVAEKLNAMGDELNDKAHELGTVRPPSIRSG